MVSFLGAHGLLASAEKCLVMCGLAEFADAMVGTLGVEQRKRTTIGVELAAKVSQPVNSEALRYSTKTTNVAEASPFLRRTDVGIGLPECLGNRILPS